MSLSINGKQVVRLLAVDASASPYFRADANRSAVLWKLVRPSSGGVLFSTKLDEIQELRYQEALTKLVARDFLGLRSAQRSEQLSIVRHEVGFDLTAIIGVLAAVISDDIQMPVV
jgi:hypothetical protein